MVVGRGKLPRQLGQPRVRVDRHGHHERELPVEAAAVLAIALQLALAEHLAGGIADHDARSEVPAGAVDPAFDVELTVGRSHKHRSHMALDRMGQLLGADAALGARTAHPAQRRRRLPGRRHRQPEYEQSQGRQQCGGPVHAAPDHSRLTGPMLGEDFGTAIGAVASICRLRAFGRASLLRPPD